MNFIKKNPAIFIFFIILMILLPSIFFGIDVQDTGFHLTNQILFNYFGLSYIGKVGIIERTYWFSNTIGAWWLLFLKGIKFYNLIGARFGGIISFALSGVLVIKCFDYYKDDNIYILLFSVIVAVICSANVISAVFIIGYKSFPVFIFTLWSYCLLCGLFGKNKNRITFAALAGLLLSLIILARLPAIPVLVIPIIILTIAFFYKDTNFFNIRQTVIVGYIFTIIAFLLIYVILKFTGQWRHIWLFPRNVPQYQYDIPYLLKSYITSFLLCVSAICFLFGLSLGIAFCKKIIFTEKILSITLVTNLFLIQIFCINILAIGSLANYFYLNWILHIFAGITVNYFNMIVFYVMAFILLIQFRKKNMFFEITLFVLAVFMPIAVACGDNEGVGEFVLGILYIIPLTTYLIFNFGKSKKILIWMWWGFLILIFILTLAKFYYHGSRDKNILALRVPFKSLNLKYVHTTPLKQKHIDKVISIINQHTTSGNHILIYPSFPIIYFATNTIPLYAHIYLSASSAYITSQELANVRNTLCISNFPDVIVRTFISGYHANWNIYKNQKYSANNILRKYDQIVEQNCKPKVIWQDNFFKVMMPQEVKKN